MIIYAGKDSTVNIKSTELQASRITQSYFWYTIL